MAILIGSLDIGKNTGKMVASTLNVDISELTKKKLLAFIVESSRLFNNTPIPKSKEKPSILKEMSKVRKESITTRADINPKSMSDSIIDIIYDLKDENPKKLTYLVGSEASTESESSSKIDDIIMACGYELITRYLKPNTKDNDVYLTLTYPLSQKDKVNVEDYIELIKKDGPIRVVKNGKFYEFTIKQILAKPEGSGLLVEKPNLFKEKDTLVFDVGGMNTSITKYINLKAKYDDIQGYELGNRKLRQLLDTYYSEEFKGKKFPGGDHVKDRAIRGLYRDPNVEKEKMDNVIKRAKDELFKSIIEHGDKYFTLASVDKILFIGGTTLNLKENIAELRDKYGDDVVEKIDDPQWIAINGLYKYTLLYYKNYFKENFKNEYK